MNYYGSKELAASFRTVRNNTIKIAEEIPEEKYAFKPSPESRTIAQTLTHIAILPTWALTIHDELKLTDMAKFDFQSFFPKVQAEEQKPRNKAEIIQFLRETGDRFASFLDNVSESTLADVVALPPGQQPPSRTRFDMLLA